MSEALRDIFLAQVAPTPRAHFSGREGLEAELQRLCERALAARPELEVDAAGLVAHVASHVSEETELDTLHAGDLRLSLACLLGEPTALAIFERDVIGRAMVAVAGNLPVGLTADEVLQQLRVRLLLRDGERAPGLSTYSGRGALVHWCRASALRLVQEHARGHRREVASDDALLDAPALTRDLDAELVKRQFAQAFTVAFKSALAQLSSRDRHLLRLHYLEGMRAEELGRIFNTHRTTIWRWMTQCREQLLGATRAELSKTVSEAELSSVMNVVHSQLDASLSRMLRAEQGDAPR